MELTLIIEGMTCEHCVNRIEKALRQLKGVESVRMTLDPGQAFVKIDPKLVDEQRLEDVIRENGYQVKEILHQQ